MTQSTHDERQPAAGRQAAAIAMLVAVTLCGCSQKEELPTRARIYQHAREAPHVLAPTPLEPGHNYSY